MLILKSNNTGLWKIALVALISAFIGVGLGFWGFSHWGGLANSNTSTNTAPVNGKAGTTHVSNVSV